MFFDVDLTFFDVDLSFFDVDLTFAPSIHRARTVQSGSLNGSFSTFARMKNDHRFHGFHAPGLFLRNLGI